VDMLRLFAKPLCARDRRRLSKKSLNLGETLIFTLKFNYDSHIFFKFLNFLFSRVYHEKERC